MLQPCTNFGLQLGTRPPSCRRDETLKAGSCATLQCPMTLRMTVVPTNCIHNGSSRDSAQSHEIAHNVTVHFIRILMKKKETFRFTIYHLSFVASRALYRYSALEIYSRRSFAPGSLLNGVSGREPDERTTEVHRSVGVASGSSIVIFEAYGGGSEFATASRRILPPSPSPFV